MKQLIKQILMEKHKGEISTFSVDSIIDTYNIFIAKYTLKGQQSNIFTVFIAKGENMITFGIPINEYIDIFTYDAIDNLHLKNFCLYLDKVISNKIKSLAKKQELHIQETGANVFIFTNSHINKLIVDLTTFSVYSNAKHEFQEIMEEIQNEIFGEFTRAIHNKNRTREDNAVYHSTLLLQSKR